MDSLQFLTSNLIVTNRKVKKVRVPETNFMRVGKPLTVGKVYDVIESYVGECGNAKSKPTLGVILSDNGDGFLIRFAGCAHLSGGAITGSTAIAWEIIE